MGFFENGLIFLSSSMDVPAFAFCTWAELCLHLHEAPQILTDADLAERIPLVDHSPVRRVEALSAAQSTGIVQRIGSRLVVCVSAVASHVELHLWDRHRIPCHRA